MSLDEIRRYVRHTPGNTNPAVLSSMIGDIGGDGEISWSQLEGMSDDEILDTLAELGLIEPAAVEGRELFIDEGGNIYVL